jgi:hypothetical protein
LRPPSSQIPVIAIVGIPVIGHPGFGIAHGGAETTLHVPDFALDSGI